MTLTFINIGILINESKIIQIFHKYSVLWRLVFMKIKDWIYINRWNERKTGSYMFVASRTNPKFTFRANNSTNFLITKDKLFRWECTVNPALVTATVDWAQSGLFVTVNPLCLHIFKYSTVSWVRSYDGLTRPVRYWLPKLSRRKLHFLLKNFIHAMLMNSQLGY